jgi:hypothetical protein
LRYDPWWIICDPGPCGPFSPTIYSLAFHQGHLFVGGEFTQAGSWPSRNLARWADDDVPGIVGDFRAYRDGSFVHLSWDVPGSPGPWEFVVYRASETRPEAQVNNYPLEGRRHYEVLDRTPPLDPVKYWLEQHRPGGEILEYGPVWVGEGAPVAASILYPVHPNPFRGAVRIDYALARDEAVRITVHDVLGRRVGTVFEGRLSSGGHNTLWSPRDEHGRPLASGVYFLRLQAGAQVSVRRTILVR